MGVQKNKFGSALHARTTGFRGRTGTYRWTKKHAWFSDAPIESVYIDTVLSELRITLFDLRLTDMGRETATTLLNFATNMVTGPHTAGEDVSSTLDLIQAARKRKANTRRIVNGALPMHWIVT